MQKGMRWKKADIANLVVHYPHDYLTKAGLESSFQKDFLFDLFEELNSDASVSFHLFQKNLESN